MMFIYGGVLVAGSASAADVDGANAAVGDPGAEIAETPSPTPATPSDPGSDEAAAIDRPFDYDPYRVLIWVAAPESEVEPLREPLNTSLSRYFDALWRSQVRPMPRTLATIIRRDLRGLDYESIIAADPVIAVKKTHPESVRIRTPQNVAQYIGKIVARPRAIEEVQTDLDQQDSSLAASLQPKWSPLEPGQTLAETWTDDSSEAILTTRGAAAFLNDPSPKLIAPPLSSGIADVIEDFDKIFLVDLHPHADRTEIAVVEMDVLMRHFGAPVLRSVANAGLVPDHMAAAITESFRPLVRIEEAGRKDATGLVRGGGLIVSEDHPALIRAGDILEPMIRKDDRNGVPFVVGPMDWAFLVVTEAEPRIVQADFWSGRAGSLQGRKNKRTFRMGLRVKPRGRGSQLRLHAKGDEDEALIGYEIYEKDLETEEMNFVGRTDWDGRLQIEPTDKPFRLLYVKNGGAVLARLPIVPGLHERDVANLTGDDDRLEAEAFVKGVQNQIIDLVAVRELFKARVNMRLQRGEMDKAEELMVELRRQPDSRELNDSIAKRQVVFLEKIENASQRKKVDLMFSTTQDLLAQFINPKLLQDLESNLLKARNNGGKLPAEVTAEEE